MSKQRPQTKDLSIPRHIAIIMDGNGRWAKARNLPRPMGHRAGMEAVRRAIKAAGAQGVEYLTLYSFSSENWRRPVAEVGELMRLLRTYLANEMEGLHKENIRIRVIGDRSRLPDDIVRMIAEAEALTKNNKKLHLTLALNYGGRQEIVSAVQALAQDIQNGKLAPEKIDEKVLASFLYTKDMPDPDLVIRTSGEKRTSNFLIWQSAYAEYVFLNVLWPDFSGEHMAQAIEDFSSRDRRFGG